MVGAARAARELGGLVERPAQRRRALARQLPGRAALIGLVDGDVQAGVTHRVPRRGESPGVAELGQDRDRGQRADAVARHQRAAARLAAPVGAQLARQRLRLGVQRVDDRQRDRDLLARRRRQVELLKPLPLFHGEQITSLRNAVVIEHGLDALLPLAALVNERVAQAHAGAQIEQVPWRNPRLGQPPDHQQLPQVPGVGAIGLGAFLVAAQRAGLRRLGEVHVGSDRLELFDDEPPAGRRLQRDLELLAGETAEELTDAIAVRRRQPGAADFPGLGVQPVGRDLCSMLVESHYDCHSGPPHAPRFITGTPCAPELRRSLHTRPDRARLMPSFGWLAVVSVAALRTLASDEVHASELAGGECPQRLGEAGVTRLAAPDACPSSTAGVSGAQADMPARRTRRYATAPVAVGACCGTTIVRRSSTIAARRIQSRKSRNAGPSWELSARPLAMSSGARTAAIQPSHAGIAWVRRTMAATLPMQTPSGSIVTMKETSLTCWNASWSAGLSPSWRAATAGPALASLIVTAATPVARTMADSQPPGPSASRSTLHR